MHGRRRNYSSRIDTPRPQTATTATTAAAANADAAAAAAINPAARMSSSRTPTAGTTPLAPLHATEEDNNTGGNDGIAQEESFFFSTNVTPVRSGKTITGSSEVRSGSGLESDSRNRNNSLFANTNNDNSSNNNNNNNNQNSKDEYTKYQEYQQKYHQPTPLPPFLKCTDVTQFDALEDAAQRFKCDDDNLHLRNLCNDPARCVALMTIHTSDYGKRKIVFDYSRQQVTEKVIASLYNLSDFMNLTDHREALRTGGKINTTKDSPVLHHVLRMPKGYDYYLSSNYANTTETTGDEHHNHLNSNQSSSSSSPSTYNTDGTKHKNNHNKRDTNVLDDVHQELDKIQDFVYKVRSGQMRGATGKKLKNTLCISIGGKSVGPQFVQEALSADFDAERASVGRTLRFLSSVDPVDFRLCTRGLDPEETLIIVISKTFTTNDVLLNARTARQWLIDHYTNYTEMDVSSYNGSTPNGDTNTATTNQKKEGQDNSGASSIVAQHMIAITSSQRGEQQCQKILDISKSNVFRFWSWVGGRFSVCSAVGVLPLSIQYSYNVVQQLLAGAHDIDEHFFTAPLRENIPIISGLLGVWNSTFMGYTARVLLPYSRALKNLPAYVQNVDMESNGKSVAVDGTPLLHSSGEITFGDTGTNGQHCFYQFLHQGQAIPADFIGFIESQYPMDIKGEAVSNHDELMSNFFAQPDALAYGKTMIDLIQEGVPEAVRPHMTCPGNRPSTSMLLTKLDAYAVGQLVAIYEHRATVQGFLWGINSFDKYGNHLGENLTKQVRSQLSASRKTNVFIQGFNSATSTMLQHYLAHEK